MAIFNSYVSHYQRVTSLNPQRSSGSLWSIFWSIFWFIFWSVFVNHLQMMIDATTTACALDPACKRHPNEHPCSSHVGLQIWSAMAGTCTRHVLRWLPQRTKPPCSSRIFQQLALLDETGGYGGYQSFHAKSWKSPLHLQSLPINPTISHVCWFNPCPPNIGATARQTRHPGVFRASPFRGLDAEGRNLHLGSGMVWHGGAEWGHRRKLGMEQKFWKLSPFPFLLVLSREWMGMGVAGMIIDSDYGSFPHSLRLAPVSHRFSTGDRSQRFAASRGLGGSLGPRLSGGRGRWSWAFLMFIHCGDEFGPYHFGSILYVSVDI